MLKAEGIAVSEADLARALGGEFAALPAYRLVVVEGDLRADLSHIADLKAEFEVETRFQLGYVIGQQGISGTEQDPPTDE